MLGIKLGAKLGIMDEGMKNWDVRSQTDRASLIGPPQAGTCWLERRTGKTGRQDRLAGETGRGHYESRVYLGSYLLHVGMHGLP